GPWIPWACFPIYDPIWGPRPPEGECLHDGGDAGIRAGFDRFGRLGGLDPADTVAEYVDSFGRRHVAVSNRVCICVPRFAVLRKELVPAGFMLAMALGNTGSTLIQAQVQTRQPSLAAQQTEQLGGMAGRERTSGAEAEMGITTFDQFQGGVAV